MTSHVPWARDVIKHVDNGAGINNDDDNKDLVKYQGKVGVTGPAGVHALQLVGKARKDVKEVAQH